MVLSPISWRAAAKSIDAKYEISEIVFFGAVPTLSREWKECLQSVFDNSQAVRISSTIYSLIYELKSLKKGMLDSSYTLPNGHGHIR